jgi:hypothetical protein
MRAGRDRSSPEQFTAMLLDQLSEDAVVFSIDPVSGTPNFTGLRRDRFCHERIHDSRPGRCCSYYWLSPLSLFPCAISCSKDPATIIIVREIQTLGESQVAVLSDKLKLYFLRVPHYFYPTFDLRILFGTFAKSVEFRDETSV